MIKHFENNTGYIDTGSEVMTFEIGSNGYQHKDSNATRSTGNYVLNVDGHFVAAYGANNDLPLQIAEDVKHNHILPEIIEKQIKLLYGQGPYLYRQEIREEERVRVPVIDNEVEDWLESWTSNGILYDHCTYLQNNIREFYYTEGVFSRYVFAKSRRVGGTLPVLGLESVQAKKSRFATKNKDYLHGVKLWDEKDFRHVIVGDWPQVINKDFKLYPRFDESDPFKHKTAINYRKNGSFGEELYSFPVFYFGLKNWIKGSNAASKQLKTFFENLLTAKFHIKIPGTWVDKKRETLKDIIESNKELYDAERPMVPKYGGIRLIKDGKPVDFSESMVNQVINNELKKITDLMSGTDNAGKLWSSIKYNGDHGVEEWELDEIPLKIKEFVESVILYNKRAVESILEGKGVDASLSNVSKDGILSQSGANVYYNYLIYLNGLQIPEEICTYDLNKAIRLNFPEKKGLRLGLYHNIPVKLQETSPQDRNPNGQNP